MFKVYVGAGSRLVEEGRVPADLAGKVHEAASIDDLPPSLRAMAFEALDAAIREGESTHVDAPSTDWWAWASLPEGAKTREEARREWEAVRDEA